jgi:hypothetical protein
MIEENVPIGKQSTFLGIPKTRLSKIDLARLKYREPGEASAYKACLRSVGCIFKCIYFPLTPCGYSPVTTVQEGFEGLFTEFGRYTRKVGPGIHGYNPCTETINKIDMR